MKRRRKFGIGLKIATLLTTLSVASVGLASWVITIPAEPVDLAGTIKVDTVSSNQVALSGNWWSVTESTVEEETVITPDKQAETPVIYYGAPSATIDGAWLNNTDSKKENLVAWLKVGADQAAAISVRFAPQGAVAEFEGAITNEYITAPTLTVWAETKTETPAEEDGGEPVVTYSYTEGAKVTYDKDAKTADTEAKDQDYVDVTCSGSNTNTYYVKIEFKWGKKFGEVNAYNHFNASSYSEALAGQAEEYLGALETALKSVTYKMTVFA